MTMTEHMLGHARRDLLAASTNLDIARKCGFPLSSAVKILYQALDRVWELQCMNTTELMRAEKCRLFDEATADREMPNPFSEVTR